MSAASVAIIDSGGANINSLMYALARLGAAARLTSDARAIRGADRVILPGVGAAADAMNRLRSAALIDVIRDLSQPVLGICLGMQLLAEGSEEEDVECLGIIPGTASLLPASTRCPVPNMGWCRIRKTANHDLLRGIEDDRHFYFVHSYALPVSDCTLAVAEHAGPFAAIACHENFMAVQFHPEKSAANGSVLLRNFLEMQQ